jgi:hypothetical protein
MYFCIFETSATKKGFEEAHAREASIFFTCTQKAKAAGDVAKEKTCLATYLKFLDFCPSTKKVAACGPPSYELEDFALDLAEELPVSDACKALGEETGPLTTCAKDAAHKDIRVAMKLLPAVSTFQTCVKDAGDDVDELVKCWKPFAGVLSESGCSAEVKDVEDTCGIPSFEFEDFFLDLAEDEELESTAYATYLRG